MSSQNGGVDEQPAQERVIGGRVPQGFDLSDLQWKYVDVRRLLVYLEHSVCLGLQWVVFEPNDEQLWTIVRRSVEDFLIGEWRDGALVGERPAEAFFVRCDRTTMTQHDLDSGRLIVEIGVAPTRPAEFVVFRIGQWTGASPRC